MSPIFKLHGFRDTFPGSHLLSGWLRGLIKRLHPPFITRLTTNFRGFKTKPTTSVLSLGAHPPTPNQGCQSPRRIFLIDSPIGDSIRQKVHQVEAKGWVKNGWLLS